MPVSTDHLADDIRELRESQQNLAEAMHGLIREFGSFRVEVVECLGAPKAVIPTEIADKSGAINSHLGWYEGRTQDNYWVDIWRIALLSPLIMGLVWGGMWISWHAGRLHWRLEHLESRLEKEPATFPTPNAR
ncbi:MAG: hypothetical protein ACLQGP_18550 [Isosphaeraceae bacterium]